jgi:ubiquinone/menaquinone biosynthesis C-methylase UbiE
MRIFNRSAKIDPTNGGRVSAQSGEDTALKEAARIVSEPWKDSPYYREAEKWMHVFWNPGTVFREFFDRCDLSRVLELAAGHGRHAEVVAPKAGELILMDVFDEHLEVCQHRLKDFRNIQYKKCTGFAFDGVGDNWATCVYCYDAMVHFSPDIVESYLKDTHRILQPGGKSLFHHSNYPAPLDRHYGLNPHARNHMTRELFCQYCNQAELTVVESRTIDWGGIPHLDCVSLVKKDF